MGGARSEAVAHRRHPPQPGFHPVEWGCELAGTCILVLGGLSAVVVDFGRGSPVAPVIHSQSYRLLLTGFLFAGSGSLVAVSPLGRRSGAHLNPALTVAFWCERHLHRHDLAGYIVAQCLGALLGASFLRLAWQGRAASVGYGVTRPGRGLTALEAVGVEALMTAALILVVFAFLSSRRTTRLTPLAVWILVAVLVWRGAPYTGTSLNPARSLGPALVAGNWHDYWVYILGPLAGTALAVGCWALLPGVTLTAKLFHDSRYPSVLGSELPAAGRLLSHPSRWTNLRATRSPAPGGSRRRRYSRGMEIASTARMGLVELTVSDLDRSLAYWQDAIGLRVLTREDGTAEMGAGAPLLRFVEEPGARPADGFTGLYHVALLVPDRPSLGRFLGHVAEQGVPLEGLSDHTVSEAIYLRDPDRHGIEVYADRPRTEWEGQVSELMTTLPLDTRSLLAEVGDDGFLGLPDATSVGHVHLRVRDVDEAVRFYRDTLGLGLMAQLGRAAAFLSAGGYHHHVGANSWETRGAAPAPAGTARLGHATIVLPDESERDRLAAAAGDAEEREDGLVVRDPSGNGILLSAL